MASLSGSVRPRVTALLACAVGLALGSACGAASDSTLPPAGGAGGQTTSHGGGGAGATGGAAGSGQGGAAGFGGGTGPQPWQAPIERCDGALDQDGDGLTDEDCPPSLWSGIYPPGGGADLSGDALTQAIEAELGRPLSVVQTYHSSSALGAQNTPGDLAAIWAHGAIPHLNVEPSGYSAAQYAAAGTDPAIGADLQGMAAAIAGALAATPGSRLLLTFGAEMNGNWTDWGCLPAATFVAFYRRFHDSVSVALGSIDPRRVRWVFGPNNVSSAACGSAAGYYPGHDVVDYLGMSSYRSGTASVASTVLDPAHALLDAVVGPHASWQEGRFILLQTGTRDEPSDDSGLWLTSLYSSLLGDPVFAGAIYFDDADWALRTATATSEGYAEWIAAMDALPRADARLDGTFEPFFWDVRQSSPYYPELQSLRAAGISSGCAASPPQFCPDAALERADAAVLLLRAFGLPPDESSPPLFDDVPSDHPAFGAIQALVEAGVLGGCSATAFCPTEAIDRQVLAIGLARLSGIAPHAGSPLFTDLDGVEDAGLIQALGAIGAVDGCAPSMFCPTEPALRAPGGAWIVRAAGVAPAPPL
jgi:hypothetical protein